ncbi:hypothetical protein F5Y10DRAFT_228098 [Nemania abortiva]|nr:hypothetical protein F5Y10DRAFT_228098 [Nemania abortiva]
MMPTHFPLQSLLSHETLQRPPTSAVTTSKKRAGEEDDDIQFISEKPVKRPRINEKQSVPPISQQPMIPFAAAVATTTTSAVFPNLPATTTLETPSNDLRDTERRLSTGMVGLPSDIHAMELTYALRGVSMPVLENFVLDQPFRKPRPPSPPELSPKQLPSTISPPTLNVQGIQYSPTAHSPAKFSSPSANHPSPSHTTRQAEKPVLAPDPIDSALDTNRAKAPETPVDPASHIPPSRGEIAGSKNTLIPLLRPSPCPESSYHAPRLGRSPRSSENYHHHNSSIQKQPCQVCSRLRHQAQFPSTQGLSMVKAALPSHFTPQLHCHPSYGQHVHPHIVAMPTGHVQQFGANFAPVMMPMNGSPLIPLPSHRQPQPLSQMVPPQQQDEVEKSKQPTSERAGKMESPKASQPKTAAASTIATPSSIKPSNSLIQPTYRKHSPNLIVDVSETCQEKFPFEEVAKRHNVPISKVFDVFAAIIQVPLLRCPTDRRRPGRLATARVKEYNKAKKEIRDSRADKSEANGQEATVDSADIAWRLGQVELPQGFTQ